MSSEISLVWFRQDLRIADNPAFLAAVKAGRPILPLYILDNENSAEWQMGGASRWWLHHSLESLQKCLKGALFVRVGDAFQVISNLINEFNVAGVYWNRCYEPWRITRDTKIKNWLKAGGIEAQSYNGSLLFEPHTNLKEDGTPYKVFTPFYTKGCLQRAPEPRRLFSTPTGFALMDGERPSIESLGLLPKIPWYLEMDECWDIGESGAQKALQAFLTEGLKNYNAGRDFPAQKNVSRLSPYLHFGELSPNQVWYAAKEAMEKQQCEGEAGNFLKELGWREFSNSLLYHFPDLPTVSLQEKFHEFPWDYNFDTLKKWQTGMTGYPIVDAGMRELWRTGYMHNRVRMIVGSFLVKNLLIHWHHGERWFWDTLLDADLANNSASWQWIAGCGADAAPYFRIFNPVTQGEKFDSEGAYVRCHVPELSQLDNKYIHAPWKAPEKELRAAGIRLGENYPMPIVDLKVSRERALAAFKSLSA